MAFSFCSQRKRRVRKQRSNNFGAPSFWRHQAGRQYSKYIPHASQKWFPGKRSKMFTVSKCLCGALNPLIIIFFALQDNWVIGNKVQVVLWEVLMTQIIGVKVIFVHMRHEVILQVPGTCVCHCDQSLNHHNTDFLELQLFVFTNDVIISGGTTWGLV